MATKELFDYNPDFGVVTHFEGDGKGGFTLHYSQECEPITDHAKAHANEAASGFDRRKEWWPVATIPIVVEMEWVRRYGINIDNKNDLPKILRVLNDPDWQWLRTMDHHLDTGRQI